MNLQNNSIHKQRLFFIAVSALGAIAAFLPWINYNIFGLSGSIQGISGDGVFTLALFIAVIVVNSLGQRNHPLAKGPTIATGVLGLIAALIPFYNIVSFQGALESTNSYMAGVEDLLSSDMYSFGFGMWLTLISGLVITAYAIFLFLQLKKQQSSVLNSDAVVPPVSTSADAGKEIATLEGDVEKTAEEKISESQADQTAEIPEESESKNEEPAEKEEVSSDSATGAKSQAAVSEDTPSNL